MPHTPGPWQRNIKPASKYPTLFAGRNTHVLSVSVSGMDPDTVEANLCLAMAAPDLLEAIEDLLPWAKGVLDTTDAEAAIAKARGK